MNAYQKIEIARSLNRALMETLVKHKVPTEDTIEVCAITMTMLCGALPEPLNQRESVSIFISVFCQFWPSGPESPPPADPDPYSRCPAPNPRTPASPRDT